MGKDLIARGLAVRALQQSDNKVKINADDNSADYLSNKLLGSDNVNVTEDMDSHTLVLNLSNDVLDSINNGGSGDAGTSTGKIAVDSTDQQDYAEAKIIGTDNKIDVSKNADDSSHKLIIAPGKDLFDKTTDSSNTIIYNNSNSTLESIHVGDAINELDGKAEQSKNDISSLSTTVSNLQSANGKIKLNSDDTADYIASKIDNTTIKISDGKLVVKTLDGLTIPVSTLNLLQGVNSNVQEQINSFTHAFHLLGAKDTKAALDSVMGMSVGDSWIVNTDETQSDTRTWYTYTDDGWILMGVVEVTVRNFSTNPIDLSKEVTGKLTQSYIDLTGLAKTSDLTNYLDKTKYDSNDDGIVDNAEKLGGHTPGYYQAASNISVDTTNFNKNLSSSENNVQLAFEKLDELVAGSGGSGSIDLSNYYDKDQVDTLVFQHSNNAKTSMLVLLGDADLSTDNTFDELSNIGTQAKTDIATALSNKGIEATPSDSLENYADKINSIAQNITIKNTKLNKAVGETYQVVLTNPTELPSFTTTVYEHQSGDTGVVKYACGFNNGDASQFNETDTITFDGKMKQNINTVVAPALATSNTDNGKIYTFEIDKTAFHTIDSIIDGVNENGDYILNIEGTYNPVFVTASGDINLSGVENITSIEWTASIENTSKLLLLFSADSGLTWHSYDKDSQTIVDVDISKVSEMESKGMTIDEVNSLTENDLTKIRNNSPKIRFGYFYEMNNANDVVENDEIKLTVDMAGSVIFSKNVDIALGEDKKTITYTFNKAGTFTINYIDNNS